MTVISVVIPTRNRPVELDACLDALAGQTLPGHLFEVIVVDDDGDAPLTSVIEKNRGGMRVELLTQAWGGPGPARNTGVAAARGELLAFTDDDCRPDHRWLETLKERLQHERGCLVGGRTVNALSANPYSAASQLITDIVYEHYNTDPTAARFFAANNMGLPRDRFEQLGGFGTDIPVAASEDRDLCDRWRHAGYGMCYAPDAVVHHAHRLTLARYCQQHYSYGRGAYHFHRRRHQRGSGTMREEMRFHRDLRNWLLRPFGARTPGEAARLAALLAVWQVANAAGFGREALAQLGRNDPERAA